MATINERNKSAARSLAAIAIIAMISLGGCRDGKARANDANRLRRGFALAVTARAPVAAAYRKTGKWPASNEEAGLPLPQKYATDTVADLTVSSGGTITVHFKAGETLQVMPDARHIPVGSRWRCKTTKFENAMAVVPCRPAI